MPTLGPTDTFNQPFFTQYHEDLIEILLWNVLPRGNICAFKGPLPIICCHIEHGSQAIISLHCKFHCRAGPFCRAKCLNSKDTFALDTLNVGAELFCYTLSNALSTMLTPI